MSHNVCKAGDLAITVGTDLPENAGLIVEVLATHVHDPRWADRHGPLCRVRTVGMRPLQFQYLVKGEWRRDMAREGTVPASRLRPITPPAGTLDEERERELNGD